MSSSLSKGGGDRTRAESGPSPSLRCSDSASAWVVSRVGSAVHSCLRKRGRGEVILMQMITRKCAMLIWARRGVGGVSAVFGGGAGFLLQGK